MKPFIDKEYIKTTLQRLRLAILTLLKWMLCSIASGIVIGLIGAFFHSLLDLAAEIRTAHPWILFLLPISGIIIVFIYRLSGCKSSKGTNLVITAIQSNEEVPLKMTPLIIVSTILTHLCGGSAGREGAALQVGGSLGNAFAKLFNFDDKDTRIMIMCGMSACFSALFGTPVAAAVFSMEVISVGIMYYAALVPCTVAALIASSISSMSGLASTRFTVGEIPQFGIPNGIKFFILSLIFAVASILLCVVLHKTSHFFTAHFENQYVRIIVAAVLVIIMRFLFGTTDYLGAGTDIIARSFVEQSAWYVFLLKMIFTAVTMAIGFKGGEIVPTLFIGSTFGCAIGAHLGLDPTFGAAVGIVAVFCGVVNCPIASILLSIELFGGEGTAFYVVAVCISYMLSGYYSIYSSQRFAYSKLRAEYVNMKAN